MKTTLITVGTFLVGGAIMTLDDITFSLFGAAIIAAAGVIAYWLSTKMPTKRD
jgi:hypothetical protein